MNSILSTYYSIRMQTIQDKKYDELERENSHDLNNQKISLTALPQHYVR